MTNLQELLDTLCPNGVVFKKIGEIADVGTGSSNGNEAVEGGEYPFFVRSQTVKAKDDYEYDEEAIIIPGEGGIGEIFHYINGKYALHQRVYRIHFTIRDIDVKFAFYYMQANFKEFIMKKAVSATVTSIRKPMVEDFPLPVPPIEVQREIVRILDNFTELTAERTAELTARKKQYEYYRDELLKPKDDIPMVTLGEIATDIFRGAGIKKDEVTEEGIPCVRYGEIYTTYHTWFKTCVSHTKLEYVQSPKWFEHGDILFAITGESVEDIATSVAYIGNERCLAGGDIVVMKHNQNPRYLAHVLATQAARAQKSKGKVKSKVVHSSVPSIQQISIPLPPLDVQERYANVLDNFEAICTDLNIGLPAEIEARKKQYEFYRDALLTFAETGSCSQFDNVEREREREREREKNRAD